MGAEEEKRRGGGEQLAAEVKGLCKIPFDFVDLAFRAAAERRRVENDSVVSVSATDFASEELVRVFDNPADRGFGQSVEGGVFACPLDHALGGVKVADICTREGRGHRRTAGIGEQIQDAELPRRFFDGFADPLPLGALFGENPEVAEVGAGKFELDGVDGNVPLLGQSVASVPVQPLFAVE